jgi:hypothetical protein
MTEKTNHPLYFMGRKIGTYDSVDIYPETGMKIFKFQPDAKCTLPAGTLFIDFGRGTARPVSSTPDLSEPIDIIEAISSCDKVTEKEFADETSAIEAVDEDEEE